MKQDETLLAKSSVAGGGRSSCRPYSPIICCDSSDHLYQYHDADGDRGLHKHNSHNNFEPSTRIHNQYRNDELDDFRNADRVSVVSDDKHVNLHDGSWRYRHADHNHDIDSDLNPNDKLAWKHLGDVIGPCSVCGSHRELHYSSTSINTAKGRGLQ